MRQVIALLLAGGSGSRIGGELPKQYIQVEGRMIIDRCIERLLACEWIDGIWIVAEEAWREDIRRLRYDYENDDSVVCRDRRLPDDEGIRSGRDWLLGFSDPGENRAYSIYHGLQDLSKGYPEDTIILIHDAARPMVSREMLEQCLEGCETYDGIMPVLPMKDTVYYASEDGTEVEHLMDRSRVYAGQAPECYRLGKYLAAYERLSEAELLALHGSTEPAVMAGMRIKLIPGEEENYKITTPADLERYRHQV